MSQVKKKPKLYKAKIGPQSNKAYAMGEITNKYILDRHYSSQEHPRGPLRAWERPPIVGYTVIPMYYW